MGEKRNPGASIVREHGRSGRAGGRWHRDRGGNGTEGPGGRCTSTFNTRPHQGLDERPLADVPVEALVAGETVEVRPGETFPVDGVILSGDTEADLSLMTGESHPIALHAGDRCVAGSINLTSTVRVRVEATGESTKVGRLLHLAEDASARKAPIIQQADRLSKYFNIGMPIAGLVGGIAWLFIEPAQAVERAVALLVVTCPCALGLATLAGRKVGIDVYTPESA